MAFTSEIIDFSRLESDAIQTKLAELNIPLTPEEAMKIQNEMLGRAPSLAELVLFSIQGSEHCSYKSSRSHLKQFTTEGPDGSWVPKKMLALYLSLQIMKAIGGVLL